MASVFPSSGSHTAHSSSVWLLPYILLACLPQNPCGKGKGKLQRHVFMKEHTAGHQLFTRQSFGRHRGLSLFVLLKPARRVPLKAGLCLFILTTLAANGG